MICAYEKCDNEIVGRSNKKYCCINHKVYQWRLDNPEKQRKINRKSERRRRKKDPEGVREMGRKWRENNPERVKELRKLWAERNPNYSKNWRLKNPEKANAIATRQRETEKYKEYHREYMREYNHWANRPEKKLARLFKAGMPISDGWGECD